MKQASRLIWVIALFVEACQPEEKPAHELSVSEIRLILSNANSDDNLIRLVNLSEALCRIEFEEGTPLMVRPSLIKSIEFDSANWLAEFHFNDQSSQTAKFIGRFDLETEDVTVDPFLTCPLAALASIEMPVKGKFKIRVHGKQPGGVAIENTFDTYRKDHQLPVLGLYENFDNQVEFIFLSGGGKVRCSKVLTLTTSEIPGKPELDVQITKNHLISEYKGLYFVSNLRMGFDQTGEVRWYYNGEGTSFFGKVRNGNFIIATANNIYFHEVTMAGQFVKEYHVPNALHHEIVELPSGNFLVASHSPPGPPYEDVVVEISRITGEVVKTWDFNLILDPSRPTLPSSLAADWLHINAMYYDEADNSIVISGRSQSAVVKVDYATGAVKWILGDHAYWGTALRPYLLKPIDEWGYPLDPTIVNGIDFWPYGPHATRKLANGNLLLYDNGDYRGYYEDPSVPQDSYTRVAEYAINEVQKTVQLTWQFHNNKSVFTKFTGYVQNLPVTNSRLVAYMWVTESTPRILELDANNQIIFDAMMNPGKASYYRTMKVDLYESIGN
jgi:arylsulfate sulfotransferase